MTTCTVNPTNARPRSALARSILRPLGSLKLTVLLLAVSMLLVFVGSLAQARRDVWLVVSEYFRTWVAWIQVKDFFPPGMFPSLIDTDWTALPIQQFPYPGGWMIGTVMCLNLLAAHMYRMRISVKGARLIVGVVSLIAAIGVTAAIIISGDAAELQTEPMISFTTLWNVLLVALGAVAVGSLIAAVTNMGGSTGARWLWAAVAVIAGATFAYYFLGGEEARLTNESMRILWQLVQGSIAGASMLIACYLLFRSRAGIVVLHLGIVLLMYSELQVAMFGKEHQLILLEGQSVNFMRDIRERELAILEVAADQPEPAPDGAVTPAVQQQVWVIPEHQLRSAAKSATVINDQRLPFEFRVERYLTNSVLRPSLDADDNPATAGLGVAAFAEEQPPQNGINDGRDVPAIYVTLNPTGDAPATHMVSQEIGEFRGRFAERVVVDGRTFDLYLRTKRTYLPWSVKLLDVSRTNYIGTSTPMDFRSTFQIIEDEKPTQEFTTWMNNPVRFSGETFYQQGYEVAPSGTELTTLQVVRNTGWMMPYIGCMVVAFGMFAHFGQVLVRFLNRTVRVTAEQETAAATQNEAADAKSPEPHSKSADANSKRGRRTSRLLNVGLPLVIVIAMAGWIGRKAAPPKPVDGGIQLKLVDQMPVAFGGRTLPFGTFAGNALQSISGKTQFEAELEPSELAQRRSEIQSLVKRIWPSKDWSIVETTDGNYPAWLDAIATTAGVPPEAAERLIRPTLTTKRPASWWMLDMIARPDIAARHRVFRIVDDQLLAMLQLEKRPGFAYSQSEIEANIGGIEDTFKEARQLLKDDRSVRLSPLQRRVHTLFGELNRARSYPFVFSTIPLPEDQPFATLVESWGLLNHLESQPGVLSIPTGAKEAGAAWQSRAAADAVIHAQAAVEQFHASTPDELRQQILAGLPRETVHSKIATSLQMLQDATQNADSALAGDDLANAVHKAATAGAGSSEDEDVKKILTLISDAPVGTTAAEIAAGLTDDQVAAINGREPAASARAVIEQLNRSGDSRSTAIRNQAHMASMTGIDVPRMLEQQAVQAVVDDLNQAVGNLLFSTEVEGETGGTAANESSSTPLSTAKIMTRANDAWETMFTAWKDRDGAAFNSAAESYQSWLVDAKLPLLHMSTIRYESFVNQFAPQYYTIFLYLIALVLTFFSWIVWQKALWRSAIGVMLLAFVVHSFYLLARMQISGRPPVTNLYSSAIFIGWVVVLGSFVFEYVSRIGLLSVIGCISGASTLTIAHYLGIEQGDTMSVMQAVLDTQFWLATHVVCVTIGYAATFLAGMLAIAYCGVSLFTNIGEQRLKLLGSIIYGTIGFALFFSFVGTVLGGLWADDSWGRFWGWDPKENGALLIVTWNALILHARWDKLVRDFGTAVLAVGGNIVTAWSWFGVNELGAGLHNYGFTEGRLLYLTWFVAGNLFVMLLATVFAKVANRRAAQN